MKNIAIFIFSIWSFMALGGDILSLEIKQSDFLFDKKGPISSKLTTLKSISKGKPFFIDFWASWCSNCMQKIPALLRLKQEHGDKFGYFALNAGESDRILNKLKNKILRKKLPNHKELRAFLEKYTVLRDPEATISKKYFDVSKIPQILLISKDGKILGRASEDDELAKLVRIILP